ncbi:hypothetical protein JHD50_00235, partial [Sulfurimonas sp. MAG313]
ALAQSDTKYSVLIENMQIDKSAIKLSHAHIQDLLSMIGEKAYAKGNINLHMQLLELKENALKGSVSLDIKEAALNAKTLKKELGLSLKTSSLNGKFRATLEGSSIDYLLKLNSELANINSKGNIQTPNKALKSTYSIDIKELALFKSLTNSPLRGPFFTKGSIQGDEVSYTISGESSLATSKTHYVLSLKDSKPQKLILNIKNASLSKLLYMLGEEPYAKALVNVDIKLTNLDPKSLKGEARLNLTKGYINQKIMKKSFQVSLPKTHFSLNSKIDLKPDNINYTLLLNSNLAKVSSKGNINPRSIKTKASYLIDIKELALLKPITKAPFRGAFKTQGSITGDKKELLLKGSSNLASSTTKYSLLVKDFKPSQATLNIQNAQLEKLLYLVGEPNYAQGKLSLKADISSIQDLELQAKLSISKGLMHKQLVKKHFDIKLPYTKFEVTNSTKIKDNYLKAQTKISSNLANITMNETTYNLKKASLKTDYKVFIPFLQRLEPLLERKMYGEVTLTGKVEQNKQLIMTAHSNIFDGSFDATIVDEKINVIFKNLRALAMLKMLGYPEVMDAPLNGTLVYNTKTSKGRFDSRFDTAQLTRSKMTDLVKNFTRTDLTEDRFNKGSLLSIINKDIIDSKLLMTSKSMSIKSKTFIINSKQQIIDARFALKVKKYPGDVIIKGKLNSPSVKLDAKSMITPEIEEKVGKEINRFLKKLF